MIIMKKEFEGVERETFKFTVNEIIDILLVEANINPGKTHTLIARTDGVFELTIERPLQFQEAPGEDYPWKIHVRKNL